MFKYIFAQNRNLFSSHSDIILLSNKVSDKTISLYDCGKRLHLLCNQIYGVMIIKKSLPSSSKRQKKTERKREKDKKVNGAISERTHERRGMKETVLY